MKNIWKQISLLSCVLGCTAFFAGCTPDEKLDLPGYPEIKPGITISDTKGSSSVTLKAKYNSQGELDLNGAVSRTYIVALPTANTGDVTLTFEPIIVNIPADKVVISAKRVVIPAGQVSAEVSVELVDEDFSFAQPDFESREYELGLKITDAVGDNVDMSGSEAKVTVKKDAYVVSCAIVGENNNAASFTRNYWDGKIYNDEPMSYTFKVTLDKPAADAVKVNFNTTGLAEAFLKDLTLTPSEIIIPAGELESEEITWTLTDDFLMTTQIPEEHTVVMTAAVETSDKTVVVAGKGAGVMTFKIKKVILSVVVDNKVGADWVELDRTGWTATGSGGWGEPGSVLDNNLYNDYYGSGEALSISVDMKAVRLIVGISVWYYGSSGSSKKVSIEVSEDGTTWESIGTLFNLPKEATHYFGILSEKNVRYVKFVSLEKHGSFHDISIMRFYTRN